MSFEKHKKLISVVVPVYNVEKYIKKCLDSIINQTYKNLEIICVYDDSKDSTVEIAKTYAKKDSRIKLIKNEGIFLGGARNTGIKNASGEYVVFVDGDDWLEPDVYKKAVKIFEKHPESDMVVWQADERDENGNITPKKYFKFSYEGLVLLNDTKRLSVTNVAWNKMYKKTTLNKYNILFPEGTINEDTCFWWKYSSVVSNAYFINEVLYHKLLRPDNIGHTLCDKERKSQSVFVITDDLYSFHKSNSILDKNLKTLVFFICSLAENDYFENNKERTVFLDKLSDYIKSKPHLANFESPFVKNMINKKYENIPELNINTYKDKIFSYKKGIRKAVLYFLGIKITKKLD